MKYTLIVIALLLITPTVVSLSQDAKSPNTNGKASTLKRVDVPKKLQDDLTAAAIRTQNALQTVYQTPQYKDFIILQNQEQALLYAVMGELGLKPMTSNCKPVYLRDGKRVLDNGTPVDSSNGRLDHFECPEPAK